METYRKITRIEKYLAKIIGEDVELPESPIYREEFYLAKIAGETVSVLPTPITRIDFYLAKIAGENVELPTPITRIDRYLAKIAGDEDVELPPRPLSEAEKYLAQWAATPQGEAVTITGVSPLLLAAALEKEITALLQSGKVSQAFTPSGSNVPIVCNNGELTMVDDELPAGYKRLTGIRFDGNTWYETGEALTGADDVTMTLDNTASQGQNVFGSYNGTASGNKNFSLFIYGNGSTSNSYFRYGGQLLRPRFGTGERTITLGNGGTDGFATDATVTPDTFETPANAYIGMLPNSTSPAYTGDIKYNILVGSRLKWIPCERESDGVIGYYEAVKGNFIGPSGTGTPVSLGYDPSHLTLSVVGTPEVITLGEQTASAVNLFAVGNYADEQDIISGAITRNVGIKVLDGTEAWIDGNYGYITEAVQDQSGETYTPLSTHFKGTTGTPQGDSNTFRCYRTSGGVGRIYIAPNRTTYPTKEDFAAYLAAQYAAGTPVIVIYPLATPTTEQTDPQTLSTAKGDNVLSVTANVSDIPLEVTYTRQN